MEFLIDRARIDRLSAGDLNNRIKAKLIIAVAISSIIPEAPANLLGCKVAGDFDGYGMLDLAVANSSSDNVSVFMVRSDESLYKIWFEVLSNFQSGFLDSRA